MEVRDHFPESYGNKTPLLPSIQPPSSEEQNSKKHKKRHRMNMKCGCAAEFWLVQVGQADNDQSIKSCNIWDDLMLGKSERNLMFEAKELEEQQAHGARN